MVMSLEGVVSKLKSGADIHALLDFNMRNETSGSRPPSVASLISRMGFLVELTDLPDDIDGRLVPHAGCKRGLKIEVGKWHTREEQRFYALHELGHAVLHVDPNDPMPNPMFFDKTSYEYDWRTDTKEREANEFVSAVSFGNHALSSAIASLGNNVPKLSKYFGLPRPVLAAAVLEIRSFDR